MSANNQTYQEYRTAESVSPKHPDKLCDQISDAILDAYLKADPRSRVAIDVAGGHGVVFVTGEVTSLATSINIAAIVERIAGPIELVSKISAQSPEIAHGVDGGGAGDQGIMVGYACNETPQLLPLEVVLSRTLNQFLYEEWPHDGKTQVTMRGSRVSSVVASFQHAPTDELRKKVQTWLASTPLIADHDTSEIQLLINPAGEWQIGGFDADAGLTGRKLAVDNYGPRVPIGGGAFSGKDPSKVDRSAAYMARKIAVDYLQKRQANEVIVRLAYAIGVADPLEATVIIDSKPETVVGYDITPSGIISYLDLQRPIYEQTARYGHFGNGYDWE